MNRAQAIQRLRALALPEADMAVHGSGVLLALGLIEEASDLDVVARGAAWAKACSLAPPEPFTSDQVVRLGDVEVFDGWFDQDLDALIDGAAWVGGLRCVAATHVLAYKERAGRPKDAPHVALLRAHLADLR